MAEKIIDIELNGHIPDYTVDEELLQSDLLVRWNKKPVGLINLKESGIVKAEDIYSNLLTIFNKQLISEVVYDKLRIEKKYPSISVIICCRDRAKNLRRCLNSLKALDYPDYETIVVDNHSIDNSVYEVAAEFNVKYSREDKPGLDFARNRGIKEALYDIVAFIDDDAIADPFWLKGIAEAFEDNSISVVTGLVLPAEASTKAQIDFEKYGGMNKGFKPFIINKKYLKTSHLYWASSWGVGANMAFKKELFERIGFFNESLDVGTPTCGGGDIEIFFRAVYFGHNLRYEPSALIKHYHRETYEQFKKQIFNNGKSFPAFILTTVGYTKKNISALKFLIYNWIFKWFILRGIKATVTMDMEELKLTFTEFSGAVVSLGSFIKSKRIAEKYRSVT